MVADLDLDDRTAAAIVEATADGIAVVDGAGRIELVNAALGEMFGVDRHELLGQPVEVLVPERYRGAHSAHRLRYRADPQARPMGGASTELYGLRSDGTEFPVEISLSPLRSEGRDHVVAVVRDVSERRQAEAHTRRVLRTLDATLEAVFLFDVDSYHFVYVNEGAAQQTGYSRDELLSGMTPSHLAPEYDADSLAGLLRPLAAGEAEARTIVTTIRRRDGRELDIEVAIQHLADDHSGPPVFVAFARDITERLESEERLRRAEHELGRMEDRERIARDLHDRIIQRLFATSLSLQATATRAGHGDVGSRVERAVDDLDEAIREIRTVIFGLHQRGSSERGLRDGVLDLCREAGRPLGFEPGVTFTGPVDTLVDPHVRTELLATLREALSNVSRHARATRVEVALRADEEVELRVSDNGIGIREGARSGDGLSNMRRRAETLGGSCTIAPGAAGGTVVTWRAPLDHDADPHPQ